MVVSSHPGEISKYVTNNRGGPNIIDDTAFAHGVLILIPVVCVAYQVIKRMGKSKLQPWTKGLILFAIWITVEILGEIYLGSPGKR
jgi:hypothetical protein